MVAGRSAELEMTGSLILALDTASSTFVSTDRLNAMHRSTAARSVGWDLSAACASAVSQRRCRPGIFDRHSAAALPARRISVDCFCIEAVDDLTNSVCSRTHSTGDSACASWLT
jgi:hypothetical protein